MHFLVYAFSTTKLTISHFSLHKYTRQGRCVFSPKARSPHHRVQGNEFLGCPASEGGASPVCVGFLLCRRAAVRPVRSRCTHQQAEQGSSRKEMSHFGRENPPVGTPPCPSTGTSPKECFTLQGNELKEVLQGKPAPLATEVCSSLPARRRLPRPGNCPKPTQNQPLPLTTTATAQEASHPLPSPNAPNGIRTSSTQRTLLPAPAAPAPPEH